MTNKIIFLNQKPKNHPLIYCVFSLLSLTSLFLSYFIKTYDSYKTYGIVKCDTKCSVNITLPYNKVNILNKESKIKYLNKEYNIEEIIYEEPYLNNEIPYQDINIVLEITGKDKIIEFQILYNKQRIINKIKEIIIERE